MSEKKIKAIETRYAGCRFRSRLEARWAVFFDAIGIEWQYELEGYVLPSGKCYLPDFFLTRLDGGIHVEVKPNESLTVEECQKLEEFSMSRNLLLLVGVPGDDEAFVVNSYTHPGSQDGVVETTDCVEIFFETIRDWGSVVFSVHPLDGRHCLAHRHLPPLNDCCLMRAKRTARSARFEFGEEG